jgi:hypothetical protein
MYKIIDGTTNVICGKNLSEYDINKLISATIINKNETIHRLWAYNGWNNGLTFDHALVGISSLKIFKYENNNLQYVLLESIENASHKKMGIFSWDRIIMELKNKTADWYGIYHGNACSHFVDFINTHITKLKEQEIKEQEIKEQALEEQEIKEQALKEQEIKEQALKEQALKEQEIKEQALKEQSLKEQTLKEHALKEQALKEHEINNNKLCKFGIHCKYKLKCKFEHTDAEHVKFIDNSKEQLVIKPKKKKLMRIGKNELDNLKVSGLRDYCVKFNLSTAECRYRADYIKLLLPYVDVKFVVKNINKYTDSDNYKSDSESDSESDDKGKANRFKRKK